MARLFIEDDALQHDPTYPGIRGWWKDTFDREFTLDWDLAAKTQIDGGDHIIRTVKIDGQQFLVTLSYDGYQVDR